MTVIERTDDADDAGPLFVRLDGVYFQRAPVRPGPIPRGYVVECVPADQLKGAVPADDAAVERMVGLLARYGWAREVREALVQDLLNAARGGQ